MTDYSQVKPEWCPHTTCQYSDSTLGGLCWGGLPENHAEGINTHRMCAHVANDDEEYTVDLLIQKGDGWAICKPLGASFGFVTQPPEG